MYLTLASIKKHLNIDSSYTGDDNYLLDLATVAEDSVASYMDRDLEDLENDEGALPAVVIHAMLLMIGNLYANREAIAYTTVVEVPLSYRYLLNLYAKWSVQ